VELRHVLLGNSGMFFWTLDTFDRSLEQADQSLHMALHRIVQALRADNHAEAVAIFSEIGNDPVDIALVEHSRSVAVVKAQFDWDDLGTWDSINRSLPSDDSENVGVTTLRMWASVVCGPSNPTATSSTTKWTACA